MNIFSNVGGTGKSYHADRRAKNQQRRIHYLLQPGWNAAIATQGFGRTHRSNQVCEPKFKLVTTDIMGQKRFTATIAKRLDQLGALTKGSSKTENNMFTEDDNLDNPIARDALSGFYSYLAYSDINGTDGEEVIRKMGLGDKLFNENGEYRENENVIYNIPLFLNRILTLEVDIQNTVFNEFLEAKQKAYIKAIEGGRIYKGLENFMADKMEVMDTQVLTEYEGGAKAEYVKLMAYTKPDIIKSEDVKEYKENFKGIVIDENKIRAVYQIASKTNARGEIVKRYHLQSPIQGIYSIYEESNYHKTIKVNEKDIFHMLTGTLLPIWDKLPSDNARVIRVVADDGNSYLGRIIPKGEIHNVFNTLLGDREDIEPEDAYKRILEDGEIARLSYHKQEIKRARVSGEYRLELTGGNLGASSRINKFIIVEKIAGNKRYFIPTALEEFKVYIVTNNLKDMMYEADIEEDLDL